MPAELAALALAVVFDLAIGEPPAPFHPVVWIGKTIGLLDKMSPRTGKVAQFIFGLFIALAVPFLFGAGAFFILHDVTYAAFVLVGFWLMKSTFAVKALADSAREVQRELENDDISTARESLRSLVSRDRSNLTREQSAGAAVESVAENSTDSFVAPLFYFALFGLVGAIVYRAINTGDSMIGYHGKYEYLGKAAARLDDFANYIPARLAAALMIIASTLAQKNAHESKRVMLRDHRRTSSPNAGWTMSAMAGSLGVRLEKLGQYVLNKGAPEPSAKTISEAILLMHIVFALMLPVTVGIFMLRYWLYGGLP